MVFKNLFLTSFLSLSIIPIFSAHGVKPYINISQLGPFEPHQSCSGVTFEYVLDATYSKVSEFVSINTHGENNPVLTGTVSHKANEGTVYSKKVAVNTQEYFTEKGVDISLGIKNSANNTYIKRVSFTLSPIVSKSINPLKDKLRDYTSETYAYKCVNSKDYFMGCYYDFRELEDYIESNIFHKLDLSNQKFRFVSDFPFEYQSANLKFLDIHNLFPDYGRNEDGYKLIPLRLNFDGEYITYSYGVDFYYDKETYRMCDYAKKNYLKTNDFYFPLNGRSLLNDYIFIVEIEHLGKALTNITYELSFYSGRNLIGPCDNSDFCIVGGIRE